MKPVGRERDIEIAKLKDIHYHTWVKNTQYCAVCSCGQTERRHIGMEAHMKYHNKIGLLTGMTHGVYGMSCQRVDSTKRDLLESRH